MGGPAHRLKDARNQASMLMGTEPFESRDREQAQGETLRNGAGTSFRRKENPGTRCLTGASAARIRSPKKRSNADINLQAVGMSRMLSSDLPRPLRQTRIDV